MTTEVPVPGPEPEKDLTVHLSGGQSLTWRLTATDADDIAAAVRTFWAEGPRIRPSDRVLGFGPDDVVTAWIHLPSVIGVEAVPVAPDPPEGST